MKKLLLSIAFTVACLTSRGAEYVSNPTFSSPFPTPPGASYFNTGTTNEYGVWKINVNGNQSSAFPTNTIDVVSPTLSIAPSGADVSPNTLLDLCGDLGPGALMQARNNLTPGVTYRLRIIAQAVPGESKDPGLRVRLVSGGSREGYYVGSSVEPLALLPLQDYIRTADASVTYNGSGHPATNSTRIPETWARVAWRTNDFIFTALSDTWSITLAGAGSHRSALLRSVSITEAE